MKKIFQRKAIITRAKYVSVIRKRKFMFFNIVCFESVVKSSCTTCVYCLL